MRNTQGLVGALKRVVSDFDGTARNAIRSGNDHVYVPVDLTPEQLDGLNDDPSQITSSNGGAEPCYASLDAANNGFNLDKTQHMSYVVIDPISNSIIDLVRRDGASRMEAEPFVKYISTHGTGPGVGSEILALGREAGHWMVPEVDQSGNFRLYASRRCSSPCLDADIFSTESLAQRTSDRLAEQNPSQKYGVADIDFDSLVAYGFLRKGLVPATAVGMHGVEERLLPIFREKAGGRIDELPAIFDAL